jgi:hypothetical protein
MHIRTKFLKNVKIFSSMYSQFSPPLVKKENWFTCKKKKNSYCMQCKCSESVRQPTGLLCVKWLNVKFIIFRQTNWTEQYSNRHTARHYMNKAAIYPFPTSKMILAASISGVKRPMKFTEWAVSAHQCSMNNMITEVCSESRFYSEPFGFWTSSIVR